MSWFTFVLLFLGLLALTPFLLRFVLFSIIFPMQARSMKGAWTKDPRFYAYSEYVQSTNAEVQGSGAHRGARHGSRRRGGGRAPHRLTPVTTKTNRDADVPELIPID
jgi:hypothetical protein